MKVIIQNRHRAEYFVHKFEIIFLSKCFTVPHSFIIATKTTYISKDFYAIIEKWKEDAFSKDYESFLKQNKGELPDNPHSLW